MSETPRTDVLAQCVTDGVVCSSIHGETTEALVKLARQLERELAQAQARIAELAKEHYAQWAPMFSRLMMVCSRLENGQPIALKEVQGWGSERPEIEQDRKNAARYRYVRARPHMLLHLRNSEFDAAIDAARSTHQDE